MADCKSQDAPKFKEFEESRTKICVHDGHATPGKAKPFFNPKMKTCRELILATVGVLCGEERTSPLTCLDAFGASGIAGLQWKLHYGDSCNVIVSEKEKPCIENITSNCIKNGLDPKPFPLDFTRIPGLPLEQQQHNQISVKHCDVNVLMHMEAFDFIHLDPFGCPVKFLLSAFTNVRNNGVLCLVATDMASLLGKYSNVAMRNYGAHIVKTEYAQEVGARVLIAAAVRAGAQCSKGIEVLYSVSRDHFTVVAVRIKRGAKSSDQSVVCVHNLLHCQICGERVFYPLSSHPVEAPYELLPCRCQAETPGKTAVILGPMWSGELFNGEFIMSMYKSSVSKYLSKTVIGLLYTLVLEAYCTNSTAFHSQLLTEIDVILRNSSTKKLIVFEKIESADIKKIVDDEKEDCAGNAVKVEYKAQFTKDVISPNCKPSENGEENTPQSEAFSDQVKEQPDPEAFSSNISTKSCDSDIVSGGRSLEKDSSHNKKRHLVSEHGKSDDVKKPKLSYQSEDNSIKNFPAFFYDLHRQNLPGLNLPKTSAVVNLLQRAGYRASRTHFNTTGVRTSATMMQIKEVLSREIQPGPVT